MISIFSKYAKPAALAVALFVAAPLALSAAPNGADLTTEVSSYTQNSNSSTTSAYNGGGAPVRRKSKRKAKAKARARAKKMRVAKRKVRRSGGHSGH